MIENVQTWPQQRQPVFRPAPSGGIQRNNFPSHQQGITSPPPAKSLSREERQEAKRLSEEANFSFSGYQVVRREFISHRFDPAMTIRGNSITFNNSCISKLEDATYVQFLINPEERKLAIRPCDEGARDAVRWCVIKGDKRKSREITCRPFTTKLYELMGWDTLYRYKLQGMKINYQGESLYLFDLTAKEAYLPQSRDPESGELKRPKPILPSEWLETFGLSVEEHTASTKIDLSNGYMEPVESENIPEENVEQTSQNNTMEVY